MSGIPFSQTKGVTIICKQCGCTAPRTGTVQKYCISCSDARHQERNRRWAAKHPCSPDAIKRYVKKSRSLTLTRGAEISDEARSSFGDSSNPDLLWYVKFRMPFHRAASKNHIYGLGGDRGHVFKRQESRQWQAALALLAKSALRDVKVVQHKIWVDILVQKPHHKFDAVNLIDLICDGLKLGVGVDDRWFCIKRLDWEIVKTNPEIFIGIGQTSAENHQACSSCGRILPFNAFGKKSGTLNGIDRNCRRCKRGYDTDEPAPTRPSRTPEERMQYRREYGRRYNRLRNQKCDSLDAPQEAIKKTEEPA